MTVNNLSVNEENFHMFAWWASILVLKIFFTVALVGFWRHYKKIFLSPEDAKAIKGSKVVYDDPDVERCRRAHLNDLENILPWVISTALWLTTSPDPSTAGFLIKTFAISRIIHTIVYAVIVVRQPARFLAFMIGLSITVYQTFATVYYYS
ncbi:microsomal glutathione S-transferase 1-like [Microplitis mediator]|uniref:microsomal glutathione S-transferase 1-like n=1 Tax=Microplitis mediator TaxID=375433 RepID=UPI002554D5A9|nr:microsomal glutathione S-transferase 1-like [Microplitis mediator]